MSQSTELTQADVEAKLAALGDVSDTQRNEIVCALIGHSNIVTGCFGYVYCGRCGAQIGDTLGGVYSNERAVIVGHNCETCRANYDRLTWRDLYLAPDAFAPEAEA